MWLILIEFQFAYLSIDQFWSFIKGVIKVTLNTPDRLSWTCGSILSVSWKSNTKYYVTFTLHAITWFNPGTSFRIQWLLIKDIDLPPHI